MTAAQKNKYGNYLKKRSLSLLPEDFKELVQLNNEIFNDNLSIERLSKNTGMIHKIQKIEIKLDKLFKTKL